jgi:hypothetical protein
MMQVEQIQSEIEALSEKDFLRLRKWFAEKDWERWDRQIVSDAEAGKLDFLLKEALSARTQGSLRDL